MSYLDEQSGREFVKGSKAVSIIFSWELLYNNHLLITGPQMYIWIARALVEFLLKSKVGPLWYKVVPSLFTTNL